MKITVSPMFSVKQNIDGHQNAGDITEEYPEKEDEYIKEEDADELARNLSSAESEDSEEEEHTKVDRGSMKGKLVWDESTLPY